MKEHDWSALPTLESPAADGDATETKWVFPETIFQQLPQMMKDAPRLPGEGARYAQIDAVLAAASRDPSLMAAMVDEAKKAEVELVTRCCSSGTGACSSMAIGRPPATTPPSAPTTSRAPRWRSRTSS